MTSVLTVVAFSLKRYASSSSEIGRKLGACSMIRCTMWWQFCSKFLGLVRAITAHWSIWLDSSKSTIHIHMLIIKRQFAACLKFLSIDAFQRLIAVRRVEAIDFYLEKVAEKTLNPHPRYIEDTGCKATSNHVTWELLTDTVVLWSVVRLLSPSHFTVNN